jgi:hypothetical protein
MSISDDVRAHLQRCNDYLRMGRCRQPDRQCAGRRSSHNEFPAVSRRSPLAACLTIDPEDVRRQFFPAVASEALRVADRRSGRVEEAGEQTIHSKRPIVPRAERLIRVNCGLS